MRGKFLFIGILGQQKDRQITILFEKDGLGIPSEISIICTKP
jgi:hypothetical protein